MSRSKINKFLFHLLIFILSLHGNLYSQVLINEVMASNTMANAIGDCDNCDWIELYNISDRTIDIGGYFLSDDPLKPSMWVFPSGTLLYSHGYLIVYTDGTGNGSHSNFKLSKEGEKVILYNKQLTIVDSLSFPYQLTNISFGRMRNKHSLTGYFEVPTPGTINDDDLMTGITPLPVFLVKGGFYAGSQTVEIKTSDTESQIYYTLDGTEPAVSSMLYTDPILLSETSVLRAKSFKTGFLPSLTITQSYFIDEAMNLPVISLVTDPDNFFSDETGIYVEGTAGVPGYCTSVPHNVNQDWERPVNIELFEKDGTTGLNQLAGVKIFGGCSRVRYPIKSLAFYARKEYETSSFNYQLFPDKPNREYETFILRTSADDQPYTLFRDALAHMVVKDVMDIDVMAYRPVVLYINGNYWGIHNMREKINEHYLNDNYGVDPDSVDLLERNPEDSWNTISGNPDHYNSMIDYLQNNDIKEQQHYDYVCKQLDVDEYINYQVTQIFLGGRDWPGNNIKFWRSKEKPYDRWRWILCDLDFTFKEYFSDIMDEATKEDCGCTWPNPPWSTYLFRRMLENETFRNVFIQRFFLFSDSYFSRERMHSFINEMQAVIAPEIPRHIERWGGQKTNLPDNTWVTPIFASVEEWEKNVQVLRDFTDTRHEIAKKQLLDYFGISGLSGISVGIEPENLGNIMLGNTPLTSSSFSADLVKGQIVDLSCKPEPGYIFSHWEMTRKLEQDSVIIKRGDEWKYLELWWDPAFDWMYLNFDDSNWNTGLAELGYGDEDESTVIGYGGDSENKMITSWFRKSFTIGDKSPFIRYTLHLLRDDGARVFLNGKEVIKDNLDRWWVGSNSLAINDIIETGETFFQTYTLNPALLSNGENVIAVEVHQSSAASPDLSFDLDLLATYLLKDTILNSGEKRLLLPVNDFTTVTAHVIPDTRVIDKIYINEVMAKNTSGYKDEQGEYEDWIEFYNAGSSAIDLAGLYLSDTIPVLDPWLIPTGYPMQTTILQGNFKVFIADKESSTRLMHGGFKLDKDGDEIALLQLVGKEYRIIDHLKFGEQTENISWGRYPDGSENFEFMPVFTPQISNYFEPVGIPFAINSNLEEEIRIYPVPTHGALFLKFNEPVKDESTPVQILVYSGTGRLVYATRHKLSGLIELSLAGQSEGIYLLRIMAGDKLIEKKVMVY